MSSQWVNRVPRTRTSDFWQPHDGSASKRDVACSLGITGPASWSSSPTQEDDHGYSSASDSLNAATTALEQGQAHRPEATAAAKTCMVDPYPIADGGADA